MTEPTNIYERVGFKIWLREHPEWLDLRDWYAVCYRAAGLRENTRRIIYWYRVQP